MNKLFLMLKKLFWMIYPARHFAFYFQRLFLNIRLRSCIAKYLARKLPQANHKNLDQQIEEKLRELKNDGISYFPNLLSATQISEIHDYVKSKLCYDRTRPQNKFFLIQNAPENCHIAAFKDDDILNCPYVLNLANDPKILSVIENLFGCKPTISNISLWWSISGHEQAEHAELFHRDVDDWHFIKLFVYLTNVDSETGPHVFVKGSQRVNKLMPIRRYLDKEVIAAFGLENLLYLEGAAGTAFLENTFGMHKGQLAKSKNRLLLQVQYSLFSIGIYEYIPVKQNIETNRVIDPYINRLYISTN